jgi:tripartite-type tricarboxylate transporter receptor subunit TctC
MSSARGGNRMKSVRKVPLGIVAAIAGLAAMSAQASAQWQPTEPIALVSQSSAGAVSFLSV